MLLETLCFARVIDPSGPNNPDYLIILGHTFFSCIYIVIGRVSVSQDFFWHYLLFCFRKKKKKN